MNRLLGTFLVCEVAYVVFARILTSHFSADLFDRELWWTGLRLLSASALAILFIRPPRVNTARSASVPARCLWATGMFLAPVLVGNIGVSGPTRYLFAATSLIVALREELAYRGILQRILTEKIGVVGALLISNVAFVVYHWGVQPFTLHYVMQLCLCGLILGIVYHISGSLALVVSLHALYDVIDSFTPYLHSRLPDFVCTLVLSLTLAALLLAERASNNRQPRLPLDGARHW